LNFHLLFAAGLLHQDIFGTFYWSFFGGKDPMEEWYLSGLVVLVALWTS
jgi:hypothetical protein